MEPVTSLILVLITNWWLLTQTNDSAREWLLEDEYERG